MHGAHFDGTDHFETVDDWNRPGSFLISGLFRFSNTADDTVILGAQNAETAIIAENVSGSAYIGFRAQHTDGTFLNGIPVSYGTWHHGYMAVDADNDRIYYGVDGAIQEGSLSGSFETPIAPVVSGLPIGGGSDVDCSVVWPHLVEGIPTSFGARTRDEMIKIIHWQNRIAGVWT